MSDQHITSSAYVGAIFEQAFDDEPPISLDLGQIERTGARRVRRRRAFSIGGAALAVAAVTAGITVSVSSLSSAPAVSSPARVPGCATVLSTDDPAVSAWRNGGTTPTPLPAVPGAPSAESSSSAAASSATAVPFTQAAIPTWFTPAKAAAMRQGLLAALPTGVQLLDVHSADTPASFLFTSSDGVVGGGGLLTGSDTRASLLIGVQPWDLGPPPCTADLTLRVTSADGTITDVIEQVQNGHTMLAESFRPDGTLVEVDLGIGAPPVRADQLLPLTAHQLATLAAAPELAISRR